MIPFSTRVPTQDQAVFQIDAISGAYYGLYIGFLLPFVPVLLKRLGASPVEMGLCMAAPFYSLILSFLALPLFSNRRAVHLVAIPTLFSRPLVGLIGFTTNSWCILAIYAVSQIVEGLGVSPYTRALQAMYSGQGRSKAMGFVRTYQAIAQITAAALGGLMIDAGAGALPFILSGISGFVSSANFLRILPRETSPRYTASVVWPREMWRTFLSNESFFWMNIVIFLFGFGNLLVYGVLPTYLVESYAISNTSLGLLNSVTNAMLVISYAGAGWFIARNGPQRGMLLALSAGVLVPWLYGVQPPLPFLALPYGFSGLMTACIDLSWPLLIISYVPVESIGTYSAVYILFMGIRGVAATLLSNLALPVVGARAFLIMAGFFTLTGLLIGIWKRDAWKSTNP